MAIFCVSNGASYANLKAIPLAVWRGEGFAGPENKFIVSGICSGLACNIDTTAFAWPVVFEAASGEEFNGNFGAASATIQCTGSTSGALLSFTTSNSAVAFKKLKLLTTVDGITSPTIYRDNMQFLLEDCGLRYTGDYDTNRTGVYSQGSTNTPLSSTRLINTIVADFPSTGVTMNNVTRGTTELDKVTIYNCNDNDNNYGFAAQACVVKNTYGYYSGSSTTLRCTFRPGSSYTLAGSVNYAASDEYGETPALSNISPSSAGFINAAAGDFRITSGSFLALAGIGAFIETAGSSSLDINLPTIGTTSNVRTLSITKDKLITLPVYSTVTLVNSPTVTKDKNVLLSYINPTSNVRTPTITKAKLVSLSTIGSTVNVRTPSVTKEKRIGPAFIGSTANVRAPSILGPITLSPEHIGSTSNIRILKILKDKLIQLQFKISSAEVYLPEIRLPKNIGLPFIEGVSLLYDPEVIGGFRPLPDIILYPAEGYGLHIRSAREMQAIIIALTKRIELLEAQ